MNRRSFLKSVAVAAGLIAAGESIAFVPERIISYRGYELPVLSYRTKVEPMIMEDGRVSIETFGEYTLRKNTTVKQRSECLQQLIPQLKATGFKRIATRIIVDITGTKTQFKTVDIEV